MKFCFTNIEKGKKLTQLLSENIDGVTLSCLNRQIKLGEVRVCGRRVRENISLEEGDTAEIFLPENSLRPIPVEIVYNDDNIVVAYKPINADTENNLVRAVETQIGGKVVPVHRLDRNTEGLVILAKDSESERLLTKAIRSRKIIKIYRALVKGHFVEKEFTAEAYLKKDASSAKVFVFDKCCDGAKRIVTSFKVIVEYDDYSDVEIRLVTGRTHQIRAHSAFLGHPILGDGKYSVNAENKKYGFKHQQLKAVRIVFAGLEGKLAYLNGKEISM